MTNLLTQAHFHFLSSLSLISAARLIFRKKKFDYVYPLFHSLHWLPVSKRITYKTCTLCFKCIHHSAALYLCNSVHLNSPSRSLRSSADTLRLRTPRYRNETFGARSFSASGPASWNNPHSFFVNPLHFHPSNPASKPIFLDNSLYPPPFLCCPKLRALAGVLVFLVFVHLDARVCVWMRRDWLFISQICALYKYFHYYYYYY